MNLWRMKNKAEEQEDSIMKCPYCGREEFVTGKQGAAYAGISVSVLKSRAVYHEICLHCGTIVRSYVKNPEKLR